MVHAGQKKYRGGRENHFRNPSFGELTNTFPKSELEFYE